MSEVEFSSEMDVVLTDHMGDDLSVVNAARLSMRGSSQTWTDGDTGLVRSLIKNGHGTPFEKVRFEFNIDVPIFVAREWFKHRMSSFNEESARYKIRRPKFWVPANSEVRTQVGKSISYAYEPLKDEEAVDRTIEALRVSAESLWTVYTALMKMGVAKEVARAVLPLSTYTMFAWGTDLRNLTNFLVLRNSKEAQWEIQKAAKDVEKAFEEVCPNIYRIWCEEGRPRLAALDG